MCYQILKTFFSLSFLDLSGTFYPAMHDNPLSLFYDSANIAALQGTFSATKIIT
jgi:hypothetical protein